MPLLNRVVYERAMHSMQVAERGRRDGHPRRDHSQCPCLWNLQLGGPVRRIGVCPWHHRGQR